MLTSLIGYLALKMPRKCGIHDDTIHDERDAFEELHDDKISCIKRTVLKDESSSTFKVK